MYFRSYLSKSYLHIIAYKIKEIFHDKSTFDNENNWTTIRQIITLIYYSEANCDTMCQIKNEHDFVYSTIKKKYFSRPLHHYIII